MSCILAGVSMDMAAGPSTLAVVADQSADWQQIKLDLVSQLEHGPDSSSQLILVGSEARELWAQTPFASEIKNQPSVRTDYVETIEEAANLINKSAPETAEIWIKSAAQLLPLIDSCGVVYVRQTSSLGDYGAIGRGCADPTDGLAKSQSGISPLSFFRLQALVEDGTTDPEFRNAASVLAEYERLLNHKKAIDSSGT
jgi:histidinol dehydrogenase